VSNDVNAPVIAGVSGSASSLAAVELAAAEAAARGTHLIVLHVATPSTLDSGSILAAAVNRSRRLYPDLTVLPQLLGGDPAEMLLGAAGEASLVVLGEPGNGYGAHHSVAAQLGNRCPVPLLVHRTRGDSGFGAHPAPVLVGVDPAAPAEGVLEMGFIEARLRGVPLLAMAVWSTASTGRAQRGGDDLGQARADVAEVLADIVSAWSDKYPEVSVAQRVQYGTDVAASLRACRSAQLLVVGAGGHQPGPGVGGVVAGVRRPDSVAQMLIREGYGPVLVVSANWPAGLGER
jgi:nucleotide-binding universal stress UspA family protein